MTQPPSSRRSGECVAALLEDETPDIVGQVCEPDLGLGASDTDGSDRQRHRSFLMGEDGLDGGANG